MVVTQPPMPPVSPQGTTYIPPVGVGAGVVSPPASTQSTGYFFCPDNKGIYPQVKSCPGAWQHLPLVPPGAIR